MINKNFKQEKVNQRRIRSKQQAELIKTEFGATSAKINDQRILNYAIDCLQKDFEINLS